MCFYFKLFILCLSIVIRQSRPNILIDITLDFVTSVTSECIVILWFVVSKFDEAQMLDT